jgi:hypothetical protein
MYTCRSRNGLGDLIDIATYKEFQALHPLIADSVRSKGPSVHPNITAELNPPLYESDLPTITIDTRMD